MCRYLYAIGVRRKERRRDDVWSSDLYGSRAAVAGNSLRVLQVGYGDGGGGAGRANYRVHRALLEAGVESRMRVRRKLSDHWTVCGPISARAKAAASVRAILGAGVSRLQRTSNS